MLVFSIALMFAAVVVDFFVDPIRRVLDAVRRRNR
jgi:hypothetical protein